MSLRAGHNHGIPSKSFLTVGQTQLTPTPRVTNTNSELPFISCSLRTRHDAECFTFLTHLICIKHLASAAVEKAGVSWESNLRLCDFGDICFLQLSSPSP